MTAWRSRRSAIGDRLNELGHQTVNGAPWDRGQVKRILDRAAAG